MKKLVVGLCAAVFAGVGLAGIPAEEDYTQYMVYSNVVLTGTQCFVPGFRIGPKNAIEADFQFSSRNVQQRIYGADSDTQKISGALLLSAYINGSSCWASCITDDPNGDWLSSGVTSDYNRHVFRSDVPARTLSLDGAVIATSMKSTAVGTTHPPLSIGASTRGDYFQFASKGKLYGVKLYEKDGTTYLLRKSYVPVVNNRGVAGLYETIGNVFVAPTNAVTNNGTHEHGPATVQAEDATGTTYAPNRLMVTAARWDGSTLLASLSIPSGVNRHLYAKMGAAYGGIGAWENEIDCGTVDTSVAVTDLPAGTQYVRFVSDDGVWSSTVELSAVLSDAPFVYLEQVTIKDVSVTFTGRIVGSGTYDLAFACADGESAFGAAKVLAAGVAAGTPFSVTYYGLSPARAYRFQPSLVGTAACAGVYACTTCASLDPEWGGATMTVADDPTDTTRLVVGFAAPETATKLVMMSGREAAGFSQAQWTKVEEVADVAAGTTSVSVAKPSDWGSGTYAVRFYLGTKTAPFIPSSRDYPAVAALQHQWDAVDNVGLRQHEATPSVWKDLAGATDLTINGSPVFSATNLWLNGGYLTGVAKDAVKAVAERKCFTIEMYLDITEGFASGKCGGVFSLGSLPPTANQRILMLDTRNESGKYGALQYMRTGWHNSALIGPSYPFNTGYHHLAVTVDSTGARLYLDGKGVHTNASPSSVTLSDFGICFGKYMTHAASKMNLFAARCHDSVLTVEEMNANAAVDRVRLTADYSAAVAVCSPVVHYLASSSILIGDVTTSGEETGDTVTISGTVSGEAAESVTVEYWTDDPAAKRTVAATMSGNDWTAVLTPVAAGRTSSYSVTAQGATSQDVKTGMFTTLGPAAAQATYARSIMRVSTTMSITEHGVGDVWYWYVAGLSPETMTPQTSPICIPNGDLTSRSTSLDLKAFAYQTVYIALVISNACANAEHGCWVNTTAMTTREMTDTATYTPVANADGDWNDATTWSMSGYGVGIPNDNNCSVALVNGRTASLRVNGAYKVGSLGLADRRDVNLALTGTVENAAVSANIIGGFMSNIVFRLCDVSLTESNGLDLGAPDASQVNYFRTRDICLDLAGTARLQFGGLLTFMLGGGGILRISDTAELAIPSSGIQIGTYEEPLRIEMSGTAPRISTYYIGETRRTCIMPNINGDVEFVFAPAENGWNEAAIQLAGAETKDIFGALKDDSKGSYRISISREAGVMKSAQKSVSKLIECRAGIDTTHLVLEPGTKRTVTYGYTYGWPSVLSEPENAGDLPTGLYATVAGRGFMVFVK